MVWMSATVDAVVGREKLMLFLSWKLLSALICPEGQLCLPYLVGLGHPSHELGQALLFLA